MLLVYSPVVNPRLQYVFELVLKEILGLNFEITDEREQFLLHKGPRFSYGKMTLKDELNFKAVQIATIAI